MFPELGRDAVDYTLHTSVHEGSNSFNRLIPPQLLHVVRTIRSLSPLEPISFLELARYVGFKPPLDAGHDNPSAPPPTSVERSAVLEVLSGGISPSGAGKLERFGKDDILNPSDRRGRHLRNELLSSLANAKSLLNTKGDSGDQPSRKQAEFLEQIFEKCGIADEAALRSLANLRRMLTDHKDDVRYLNVVGTIGSTILHTVSILMTSIESLYVEMCRIMVPTDHTCSMPKPQNKGRSSKATKPDAPCPGESALVNETMSVCNEHKVILLTMIKRRREPENENPEYVDRIEFCEGC